MAENEKPILVREVIQRDGSRAFGLRVFCSRKDQSVALDVCRACPACLEIGGDPSGASAWLKCAPTVSGDKTGEAAADPRASGGESATAVGAILKTTVTGVRDDVPYPALWSLFVDRALSRVFVLDDTDRVVGVVGELDLLDARLLHPSPTAGRLMSTVHAIAEDTPLRVALVEMATSRLRQAPIVTREGVLLGTLVDVDGLSWIASRVRRV